MMIIGIDGSPRKVGNTKKLLKKVLTGAEEAGGDFTCLKTQGTCRFLLVR
jgi:multimeric flavodoxin WrbA